MYFIKMFVTNPAAMDDVKFFHSTAFDRIKNFLNLTRLNRFKYSVIFSLNIRGLAAKQVNSQQKNKVQAIWCLRNF